MQSRIPSTSSVSQYKLFSQRFFLEQIIKEVACITYSLSILIDHILTSSREKISQSGVISIGVPDYLLIYLTWKLHGMTSNTHKQVKIRTLKNYTIGSLNWGLRMISIPDCEHLNSVSITYSDFVQHITPVINKILPFKEIRIKINFAEI